MIVSLGSRRQPVAERSRVNIEYNLDAAEE